MRKSKGDGESGWQRWERLDAPPWFRRFHKYSFEQVADVARMLYARTPTNSVKFAECRKDSEGWFWLVQTAFAWLDLVRDNYETVVALSRGVDASKSRDERRAEKRNAELKGLPDPVPFDKAVCKIMKDRHFDRALPRFKELMRVASFLLEHIGAGTPSELLKRWPIEGIPLQYVHRLHCAHECRVEMYRAKVKEKLPKKRKRKPRLPGE